MSHMLNKGSDPMILSLPIELVAGISLIIILTVIYVVALYKRMNLGKKITLYCQPEDIMNVLHMIERKINVNPEIV